MTCKRTLDQRNGRKASEWQFRLTDLQRAGRLQFFFHCAQSQLPIRDVVGRRKKEPHIERNAENYCVQCYQNNIVGFLRSRETYLFLFTTCTSRQPTLRDYRGKRFIVGYVTKQRWLDRGGHYAVQGFTKIVRFEAAFPLSEFGPRANHWRVKKLDPRETSMVLEHLAGAKNIRSECVREIRRLSNPSLSQTRRCR